MAGKNDEVLQKQSEFGKIPDSPEPNEEIALDFAGPSQNAKHGKQYLLVTLYNFSAWPDAICLHKATTEKVIEFFLKVYSAIWNPKKNTVRPRSGVYEETIDEILQTMSYSTCNLSGP